MPLKLRLLLAVALPLAGCAPKQDAGARRDAPLVRAAPAVPTRFVSRIEAIGTARANEQVTLAAPVTERITSLNFADGGLVRRGQVIATLARGQETAELAQASAMAREAGQQLARVQTLRSRGFATNASLDTQLATVAATRAQAAQAEAAIGDRVIRAPFTGVASLRTISAGAVVTAGTEIATISDVSRIKLDFPVPETMLASIRAGQPIAVRAAAFPDRAFRGTIATIDPVVDAATRSVTIRAILPNADRTLKPGMLLAVTIESAARTALAVPELAVVGEGEQRSVYVVAAGSKVRRTVVRTGERQAGAVEIASGLRPGEKVVTEGVGKLSEGMTVRLAGAGPG